MPRRPLPAKSRWSIAMLAVASLVVGLVGGVPSAAFAVPPSTITLVSDRTEFGTGQTALLTATTDYAATTTLPTKIIDQTSGSTLKTCTSGVTCSISTSFMTGGPHTYVATVNGLSSGYVVLARQAWTVSLTTTANTFATGQVVTLTATANQTMSTAGYQLAIYDTTTGSRLVVCTSGSTCSKSSTVSSGFVVNDGPHTFVAVVSRYSSTFQYYADLVDVQATSTVVTLERMAWTVELTISTNVFPAQEPVTLTATANQDVSYTGYNYTITIFDITTGVQKKICTSGTTCTLVSSSLYYTGGPHSYAAVVANNRNTTVHYSDVADLQATSNTVSLARLPWTASVGTSAVPRPTGSDPDRVELFFTTELNQAIGLSGYDANLYNYSTGARVARCDHHGCDDTVILGGKSPVPCYVLVIGLTTSTYFSGLYDVQAMSGCAPVANRGPTGVGELIGGGNASESYCPTCHGDPVNTGTGEFFLPVTDVGIPGAGPSLAVSRTYSSALAATNGPFGYGWSTNFSAKLGVLVAGDTLDPLPRQVQITQENGATVVFTEGADHLYLAPARVHATLTWDAATSEWTFTRQSREVMAFDSAGRLAEVRDLHGNAVAVGYDGSNQVTTLSGSGGRTLTLTWAGGRVTQVADSAGRTVSYAYSGGNLTAVTAVDGTVSNYGYDSAHYMTSLTKPGSAVTTNVYDSLHRVTSQTDPLGRVMTFAYTSTTATITDPGGAKTVETYSGGRMVSQTVAATTSLAATTSNTYDEAGNLLTVTNPLGQVTSMTYDADGNMLTKTDPLGRTSSWTYNALRNPLTSTDPMGHVSTFTYNAFGDLLTSTSPGGRVQQVTYNTDGTVATSVDAAGKVTSFAYDAAGRLASTTDPDGLVSAIGYDAAGNLATTTGPDGESTTVTTDAAGRVLSVTDPNGHTSSTVYDVRGNTLSSTDANGSVTSSTYDAVDRVTSTTDAGGGVTLYTFTTAGQLATVADANSHTTTYAYNARGELTSVTDPNSRVTAYTYDAAGRTLTTTLPSGAISSVEYDAAGQVTSSTNPMNQVTYFAYNLAGQLTSTTDPLGRVVTSAYTDDGQPSTVTLPDTSTQVSAYTTTGQLASFTDADGKVTSYTYSDAGRLLGKVEPGGLVTSVSYDAAGRTDTVTRPDGSTQSYSYDAAGQVIGVDYSGSGSDITYAYDAGGRVTSVTDTTGTTSFVYNTAGRLQSETDGDGATVSYGYDPVGQMTSVTYPGSRTATYAYDAAGQMMSLTDWASHTTTFDWTADGQLATQTDANGVVQTNSYDAVGRTTLISDTSTAGALASFGYGYDAAGQLISDTSTNGGATTAHDYGYDPLSQLGSVATTPAGGSTTTAAFDASAAGKLVATAGGDTLTYNAAQQLTDLVPVTGGAVSYAYDARGSRTSSTIVASGPNPTLTTSHAYTASGALESVTTPTTTVDYTVDGRGLRQSRIVGATTDDFVWSTIGGLPLLLDDGDHTYLYGPSLTPVAQIDGAGAIEYLHGDLLGSVRMITDSTGAIVGANTFDAFGTRTAHTGTADSAFGFTGNWTDPDTGLVHLRARDYDPGTGQFLSVDPAVDTTRQPYAYTGNSPLSRTDPSGLCPLTDGTNVADCTPEGLGGWTWLASGAPSEVLDFLEPSANSLAGLADGATGGLTEQGRIANGSDCQIEKDGWYWTEFGLGTVASLVTGGAVIKALSKISRVFEMLSSFSRVNSAIANAGRAEELAVAFGHGARHLAGVAADAGAVEAAIIAHVHALAVEGALGGFWGEVVVGGVVLQYRAYDLAEGVIHVGTYYVPKLLQSILRR